MTPVWRSRSGINSPSFESTIRIAILAGYARDLTRSSRERGRSTCWMNERGERAWSPLASDWSSSISLHAGSFRCKTPMRICSGRIAAAYVVTGKPPRRSTATRFRQIGASFLRLLPSVRRLVLTRRWLSAGGDRLALAPETAEQHPAHLIAETLFDEIHFRVLQQFAFASHLRRPDGASVAGSIEEVQQLFLSGPFVCIVELRDGRLDAFKLLDGLVDPTIDRNLVGYNDVAMHGRAAGRKSTRVSKTRRSQRFHIPPGRISADR